MHGVSARDRHFEHKLCSEKTAFLFSYLTSSQFNHFVKRLGISRPFDLVVYILVMVGLDFIIAYISLSLILYICLYGELHVEILDSVL